MNNNMNTGYQGYSRSVRSAQAIEFIKMLKEVNWEGNKLPDNLTVDGSLYLGSTQIKTLPDNLTVGGGLDLYGTQIKTLPDNLTVGGSLYLGRTQIKTLPDNLTVGRWLDLYGTQIKTLPDNLTVGGALDLYRTQIKTLPDNLTVGGRIFPFNLDTNKDKRLKHGVVTDKYVYADNILTHIKTIKKINDFTLYISPYKTAVARKGNTFAHGDSIREAIQDLRFKMAKKNIEEYRDLTRDSVLTFEEAVMMYRVITGACQYGVDKFIEENSIEIRDYTVGEILELTSGHYGHERLKDFFKTE
jgi:hypothetical protein